MSVCYYERTHSALFCKPIKAAVLEERRGQGLFETFIGFEKEAGALLLSRVTMEQHAEFDARRNRHDSGVRTTMDSGGDDDVGSPGLLYTSPSPRDGT